MLLLLSTLALCCSLYALICRDLAYALLALALAAFLFQCRIAFAIYRTHQPAKPANKRRGQCSTLIFLGSGGHTAEMVRLVAQLDPTRYTPRTYLISSGDTLSQMKAVELEKHFQSEQKGHRLADLMLLNGPGTCVPIAYCGFLLKLYNLSTPKIMYLESFARVSTCSLSGKLLRPIVDTFIVQWDQFQAFNVNRRWYQAEMQYKGWLM